MYSKENNWTYWLLLAHSMQIMPILLSPCNSLDKKRDKFYEKKHWLFLKKERKIGQKWVNHTKIVPIKIKNVMKNCIA